MYTRSYVTRNFHKNTVPSNARNAKFTLPAVAYVGVGCKGFASNFFSFEAKRENLMKGTHRFFCFISLPNFRFVSQPKISRNYWAYFRFILLGFFVSFRFQFSFQSDSMLYVHVHAACPSPCPILAMLHVHAAYPCPCYMSMSILHVYVHAACPSCAACPVGYIDFTQKMTFLAVFLNEKRYLGLF